MKRYILTGMPGCGKTAIIRALEMQGYFVIEEAATDAIAYEQTQGNAAPWEQPCFIDQIVSLQKQRQIAIEGVAANLQFYDRSPICTYTLATYLGFAPSSALLHEIARIQKNHIYQTQVFFIENLGFCTPTQARTITFEEALPFESLHAETYTQFGYECVFIPQASVLERVETILGLV
jgi:predicted ATPase